MQQNMQGPDYRTNYGLEVWGIPGLNSSGVGGPGSFDLDRYSGMPQVSTGLSGLGNDSTWTPVWRDERRYTVSANLTQTINVVGNAKPGFGEPGPDERWYDPPAFAQPGNAWGNSGRNQFRAPGNWNMDASVFRTIPFSHYYYRLEIRAESQNVFNHAQWGTPNTDFTNPNFMRIRSYSGNRAPRTVQLGARFVF